MAGVKGQWPQTETQEVSLKFKEEPFFVMSVLQH